MALKERYVDFFHKGTSVYVFFCQRDKRNFTGQFEKFRDWDNKNVCPAGLYLEHLQFFY
jgi:hypothetical protein